MVQRSESPDAGRPRGGEPANGEPAAGADPVGLGREVLGGNPSAWADWPARVRVVGGAVRRAGTARLIAGVAVVVAVVAVGAWSLRPVASPDARAAALPLASRNGTASAVIAAPATGSPPTTPVAAVPTTSMPVPIWVAVTGAITRPGLYHLNAGARLSELVYVAGGLAADADADRVNLAALVQDGERVYVPRRGDEAAPPVIAGSGSGVVPAPGAAGTGAGGAGARPATTVGRVNLNTASAEQLDALPGVGPATAAAIVEHRTGRGRFVTVDDLAEVRGIGPAKLEALRPLVTV